MLYFDESPNMKSLISIRHKSSCYQFPFSMILQSAINNLLDYGRKTTGGEMNLSSSRKISSWPIIILMCCVDAVAMLLSTVVAETKLL
uniref:Uncharacterized protein n=1 Tax=Glossina pallidipes TaxID=7398 RepID=A0A1A9ZPU2_GLOPL